MIDAARDNLGKHLGRREQDGDINETNGAGIVNGICGKVEVIGFDLCVFCIPAITVPPRSTHHEGTMARNLTRHIDNGERLSQPRLRSTENPDGRSLQRKGVMIDMEHHGILHSSPRSGRSWRTPPGKK